MPHMRTLYELMEVWSPVTETGNTPHLPLLPLNPRAPSWELGLEVKSVGSEMNSLNSAMPDTVIKRHESEGSKGLLWIRFSIRMISLVKITVSYITWEE